MTITSLFVVVFAACLVIVLCLNLVVLKIELGAEYRKDRKFTKEFSYWVAKKFCTEIFTIQL